MGVVEAILLAIGIGLLLSTTGRKARRERLRALERRIDLLLANLGADDDAAPPPSDRVQHLVGRGEVIQAIKAYREENPAFGLKEAKERIDRYRGVSSLRPDLDRAIRKLDVALRALDIDPEATLSIDDEVRELARAGRSLDAIRLVRERNPGLGLAEAKAIVEGL